MIDTDAKRHEIAQKILKRTREQQAKTPNVQKALKAKLRKIEKGLLNLATAISSGADFQTLNDEMKYFEEKKERIQAEIKNLDDTPKERLPNVSNIAKKLAKYGQIKTYSEDDQKSILNAVCLEIRASDYNITMTTVLDINGGGGGN